jgi:HK97 family phage major capsid protein
MKCKRPFLSATLALLALVITLVTLGIPTGHAFGLLVLGQLTIMSFSRQQAACFVAAVTREQVDEMSDILDGMKGYSDMLAELKEVAQEEGGVKKLIRYLVKEIKWIGGVPFVTEECARGLFGWFLLDVARLENGKAIDSLIPERNKRERILRYSAECLGTDLKTAMEMTHKAALDSTSTPLPTVYVPQVVELVWHYGQARQYATVYPLGAGTVKLPRLKAGEDDFGYLGVGTAGMSQAVGEKKVTAELVTFTANKAGGLIRIPSEIEEDTFIPLGQFLARYIARQLAKLEDKTMFLGDGTSTYANQTGIGPYCVANPTYLQTLAGGKTKPSDATIADFRNLRSSVNAAVLVDAPAYYMHPSMEALLVTFNTLNNPLIYQRMNGTNPATLDGFPIHWVGILQPYATTAAASAFLAMFGALSYWFLGERGAPRIEVSREVFFATDEIAMRALERIDVEAMAIDAMSALRTAAA